MINTLAGKLEWNRQVQLSMEQQIQFYTKSFEAMGELSDDQKTYMNEYLSSIEAQAKEQLLEIDRDEWGQNIAVSQSDGARRVAYGYCRLGGIRSFFTADQGDSGEYSHQYITLTYHEIKQVEKLFLDNREVEFSTNRDGAGRLIFGWSIGTVWGRPLIGMVFLSAVSRGTATQEANPDLLSQSSLLFPTLWSADHRQRGYSGIYLILVYDSSVFLSGNPEISVEGYWKNDIYDPRTDTTSWTDNSALIWADYMTMTTQQGGPGYTYDDIDIPALIEAADICDELVPLAAGGTEKRYRTNGYFDLSSGYSHDKVKQDLEMAMAGSSTFVGGKWKVFAGAWREPVLTIGVDQFRGNLEVQVKPPLENIFNRVKGLYLSPENNWEMTEYPPVTNSTYATEDGAERWEELDLVMVSSGSQSQRIAKIKLEEGRQWYVVSGEFGTETFQLTPEDVVLVNYERFGWEEKPFKVISLDGKISGPKITTTLVLAETAEAIYTWSEEETTIDLAPNTTLPDPTYVRVPVGIAIESGTSQLDIRSDGTIFSRIKVSWTASVDVFVLSGGLHEIQIKLSSESDWRNGAIVGGRDTFAYILDVKDSENYDIRLRATTPFGQSEWLTSSNHFVAGKSEIPSTPTGFTYEIRNGDIVLKWSAVTDKDLAAYEVRLGSTFDLGTSLVITRATNYTYKSLAAGSHTFWVKAIDTSDNYSDPRSLTVTILPPGETGVIDGLAIFSLVRLTWEPAPQGTFPIVKYNVYRGDTFGSATKLGEINANIFPIQEQSGGTYTYWVEPVDSYGNVGTASYLVLIVRPFTFFQLITDAVLDDSHITASTNALVEDLQVLLGIDLVTTWNNHFIDNSWTDYDDQVTAGYPYWIQPTLTAGAVTFVYDYGTSIDTAQIGFDIDGEWVDGSGTVVIKVATSPDNSTWTEETATSMVGVSFRYVRLKVETTGSDDTSFYSIDYPRLRIDVLTEEDYGTVTTNSADGSGTLVTYNKDFLDVFENSVALTPKTSTARTVSYTFSGNNMYVFTWDMSGTRTSDPVAWKVTGVVAR